MRWLGKQVHRSSVLMGSVLVAIFGCTVDEPQDPVASSSGMGSGSSGMGPGSSGMGPVTSASTTVGGTVGSSGVADSTGSAGCGAIAGEGFAVGQIAENWTLMDASGSPVNLHDYCGRVVYIELGAEW